MKCRGGTRGQMRGWHLKLASITTYVNKHLAIKKRVFIQY